MRLLERSDPRDRFGRLLAIIVTALLVSAIQQDWAVTVGAVVNVVLVVVAFRSTGLRISLSHTTVLAVVAVTAAALIAIADVDSTGAGISSFLQFALLVVIVVAMLRSVLAHDVVSIQTILGAISAYLLIGMAFSWLYFGMSCFDPDAFSMNASTPTAFPEYSFVVLTTLGFGNQLPVAPFAARITVMEAVVGQIFLATFVARLVSLFPGRHSDKAT